MNIISGNLALSLARCGKDRFLYTRNHVLAGVSQKRYLKIKVKKKLDGKS